METNSEDTSFKDEIIVYYDGECPFCQNYSEYLYLKNNYSFQILDARQYPEKMKEFYQMGYDINTGMILSYNNQLFVGRKAVNKIGKLSHKIRLKDKILDAILSNRYGMIILYPLIKGMRRLVLLFLGVKKFNHNTRIP